MRIEVKLYAMLRERAGTGRLEIELAEGSTVADAIREAAQVGGLGELLERMPVRLAVNREYADEGAPISAGDELVMIPPVSGGERIHARVSSESLSLTEVAARVSDPGAGAVVSFQGVTRDVERLDYEAYEEMAAERIESILGEVAARHRLLGVAAEHRVGSVPLSEPSVIVAASAAHRGEAFAGAREAIDRIKVEAPIWKREVEGEEQRWVEGVVPAVEGAVADLEVRSATPGDLPAVAAIYDVAIERTPATFDLEPKPLAWWEALLTACEGEDGHELLVAVAEHGEVLGYAKSGEHRAKAAYRTTVEVSVYLAEGHRGRGVGTALYGALLERLERSGVRVAVAGVTQPNEASHRLHRAQGFTEVGTFREVGVKNGRAWDVRWYERPVGEPAR